MDTTVKYIKMCEEAKEIQKTRNGFSSDYSGEIWAIRKDKVLRLTYSKYYVGGAWLPRQDQLQEMLIFANYPCQSLSFLLQWKKENKIMLSSYRSMEQLWLCFVMKKLYNKICDDKELRWIQL